MYCLNKIDAISIEELDLLYRIPHAVPISSEHGWNLDELMEAMWEKLNLKRVYTKPKGKQPDYSAPVVLRANKSTVEDFVSANVLFIMAVFPRDRPPGRALFFSSAHCSLTETCFLQCNAIHRTIVEQFKSAVVYGKSVKHQPQRVGLGHELADEDVGEC